MLEEFEYNGKAMGTDYSIAIVCDSKELADRLYDNTKNDIHEYESCFSRFLPNSELSILNENKSMIVSKKLFYVTEKSYELFTTTRGIFNPLIQVSRLGYDKNFNDIKDVLNTEDNSYYDIDFSSVVLDKNKLHINLNEGQRLDYGGFLKGYLAEILAKKIKLYSNKINGVIVNLGGDIYTEGLDKNGEKFVFNIYNPVLKNNEINVTLYNQGLATSGIYKRSWSFIGKKMHHILDFSGKKNPESDVVSASVIHRDGAIAEAFTKVFISVDYKEALKILGNDIKFVIIKNNGEVVKN